MPDGKVGRNKSVKAIRLMGVDQAVAALRGVKLSITTKGAVILRDLELLGVLARALLERVHILLQRANVRHPGMHIGRRRVQLRPSNSDSTMPRQYSASWRGTASICNWPK